MSYAFSFFSDEVSQNRSVKLQSIDFGIYFKNSFDLCFVLKREICNIENEGLGEFLQGYGTPLFVSSEYSLKFGSYSYLHFNGKLQLISVVEMQFLGDFCFTLIGDIYDENYEIVHKRKNSSEQQRSERSRTPIARRICAFSLIFLIWTRDCL